MLGLYVMIGWSVTNPAMVGIVPGSPVMVFNTAICFVITGLWFILKPTVVFDNTSNFTQTFITVLSFSLLIIPGLVLAEIVGDFNLGIDWLSRHSLIVDRNPTPGRMAPNTCVAFIFIGTAFLCDHTQNIKLKKTAFIALGTATFLLGTTSVLGYAMDLDWLYSLVQQNRMSIMTATGLSLIGIILIVAAQSSTYNMPTDTKGEDVRLTRIAAIIMIVLSLASGLTGFIVLKQGTDQSLRDQLQQKAINSAESFSTSLERRFVLADKLLSFPVMAKDLETLPVTPNDAASLEHIRKVGSILIDLGFSGLQIQDRQGKEVFSLGDLFPNPDVSIPVKITGQDAELIWKEGYILSVERPIIKNGVTFGKVITTQKIPGLDRVLRAMQFSGDTTDTGLCHRTGDTFECFPSRFVGRTRGIPMFDKGGPAYPMSHALLGETGIIYANDIRGIPVLAAYAPIGSSGLGIVTKIETTELYSFIRERLHILLAILASFVILGTFILRSRLQPLASRLVNSEQRTRAANELLEQDANRLNRIIEVQNKVALAPLDIAATLQVIVDQVQILTHAAGAVVELIDGDELFYRATSGSFVDYKGFRLNIQGSLSGHCIHSRSIIRCDDTETDPRTDKVATRKLNIRSMIVAPLISEGAVIGVLKTAASEPNAFGYQEEQALQLLSGLIGSAISHQQDFEEKQRLLSERTDALANLKETTDFLRASEERTRIIIESAYDAFIAMDSNGRITDWNKQAEVIFGWGKKEVMGQKLTDLIMPPSSRPVYSEYMAQALAADYQPEQSQRLELTVLQRSGERIIVEMTTSPIRTGNNVMLAAFLHDITERKHIQQKLTHLAQYDALTELPNRSLFMDRLSVAALRADRSSKALALMFLDLDGFKKINDNYGHHAGDLLLKQFAGRLSVTVRRTDTVSRLAGDEFTIILEDLADAEHDVQIVAAKIVQAMTEPFDLAGEKVIVTTSIGITVSKSGKKNIDELIQSSDAQMYIAKNKGKNQFSLGWL